MHPSRQPRRAFAAPLVMIAAVPACIVTTKGGDSGGPSGEPARIANPPPPRTDPAEHPGHDHGPPRPRVDPPGETRHPGDTATPEPAAAHARSWTVTMAANGTCSAQLEVQCQPNATCNPPPPRPVECPAGITAKRPWTLYADAGSTECYAVAPMPDCPPKATCNPPPPRKHACPQ